MNLFRGSNLGGFKTGKKNRSRDWDPIGPTKKKPGKILVGAGGKRGGDGGVRSGQELQT